MGERNGRLMHMRWTARSSHDAGSPSSKAPKDYKRVAITGIATLSALLVGGIGYAVIDERQTEVRIGESTPVYTPKHSPPAVDVPNSGGPTALFIGDSYTYGTGAQSKKGRWTSLVAEQMGWREVNRGLGGTGYASTSTVEGCGRDFCPAYGGNISDSAAIQVDIVVISGGQNDYDDYVGSPDTVKQAVTETFAAAEETFGNARIIAIGPSTPSEITDVTIGIDAAVQIAAREVNAQYISLIEPDVIEDEVVTEDGGHVNDEGHAAIAQRVVSALR